MKTPIVLFLLGTLLVGCAKEKSYEEVYKDNTFTKANFAMDEKDPWKDPWVYVPSVENTPMNISASRPYSLGDQKLVVFKFTENELEVLELPTDKKFTQNENNFSPVFKLDIEHKDFRCQEDQYGECSNKEEEVNDKHWASKRFFKADFSKLTVLETNSLPEQLANLFSSCFADKGSVVKSIKMDKESLNIIVERTLTSSVQCSDIETLADLRNLTFKVNHHYSFVKLSKLASKDYEAVKYPFTDQNSFGFFTTVTKKLTADNRETLDSEVTLMNRWSPKKKEIIYHLSEGFYEKGMEKLKDSTVKAIKTINTSFEKAGVDMKIVLEDGRGKTVGDLRNNFLVLVTDPQASGVIGYGPSVTNPLTGEIVKGQVVMFYGTIRKYIQETYDELVLEAQEKAKNAQSAAAAIEEKVAQNGELKEGVEQELAKTERVNQHMHKELLSLFKISESIGRGPAPAIQIGTSRISESKLNQRLKSEIFSHDRILKHHSLDDMVEDMSRNNMYHHSMVNWNEAVASAIDAGEIDLTGAKPWNELSDEEKELMIDKLMPYVWIPTLVHEFGHNLGLRHNFSGSEDKDNYYSEAERLAHGIDRNVTYSSVMDYSHSSLNQLPIMGKYDIAALRFGYGRQIELKDGTISSLPQPSLEEMKKAGTISTMKTYEYCTDEHTSVNAGCNRFDEGSTMKEMAQHYVDTYKKNYEKRNKRNNRLDYSSVDDHMYYSSVRQTFEGLRIFFETFDRIKGIYPTLAAEQWESIEFLKDIKEATTIAAKFYLDVLKTPSVHCAVVDIKTNKLAGIIPLENITQDAISCFDEENLLLDKTKYAAIAQTGKHINHARGPGLRGDIKADPSQLEMRGIWLDKVLAMDYLMKREMKISTFDDYRTSFIDHPEFRDEIMAVVLGFMSDKLTLDVELESATGQKIPYQHTFEMGETLNIKKSFSSPMNNFLGIKKASIDFRELAFPILKKNLQTADDETKTKGILESLSAYKVGANVFVNPAAIAGEVKIKDTSGREISQFVATQSNTLALKMIQDREVRVKLEKFERAKLIEVYLARQEVKDPTEVPVELAEVYKVELEKLESYLLGQMPSDTLLNKIFSIMNY